MDRKQVSLVLQLIVGVILLLFILHSLNLEKLSGILFKANIPLLAFGIVAYLLLNALNAFKLGLLIRPGKKLFGFRELFFINLAGMLASDVTPGRVGYFYAIALLREKLKKVHGAAALTIFQLTELVVKVVGALVAFLLLMSFLSGTELPSYFFLAFGLIVIAIIFILLVSFSRHSNLLFKWSKRLMPSFISFQEHTKATKKVFVTALGITLLGWFIRGLEWFFVAQAVGLRISVVQAVLLHPLITIFAFIPVSIAGLGVVEFAGITVITNMGVATAGKAAETVLAFLLLDRAMNISIDMLGLKRLLKW
ncbi:MAG: flippase-like domain-containing protein [Candidatus Diapherotrites archaeon]|nr:flippase-like domain-containing protein [Candidatus Diapherotrites archaeon]